MFLFKQIKYKGIFGKYGINKQMKYNINNINGFSDAKYSTFFLILFINDTNLRKSYFLILFFILQIYEKFIYYQNIYQYFR